MISERVSGLFSLPFRFMCGRTTITSSCLSSFLLSCAACLRTQLRNMFHDRSPDGLCQFGRHCVSDHASDSLAIELLIRWPKLVSSREGLKKCCFTQSDCPVLFRMAESPVPDSGAKRRHRRSGLVPPHSAIDRVVAFTRLPLVAVEHQIFRPFMPCPAIVRGCTNTFEIGLRQLRCHVK